MQLVSIVEVLKKTNKAKEEKQNHTKLYPPEIMTTNFFSYFCLVKHLHTFYKHLQPY